MIKARIDVIIVLLLKAAVGLWAFATCLGSELKALEDTPTQVLQAVLQDFPATFGERLHPHRLKALTVDELFEEGCLDFSRKGQMLQDSGFTLGVFDDDDLDGRFLGDFNLQTKRGGKILQILAFACQFVASAEVRKVDVALKVLDEVKGMDQVCFPSVQFLHREGEDVEGAAWLERERHGSDAPANEAIDNLMQIIIRHIFRLHGGVYYSRRMLQMAFPESLMDDKC